MPSSKRYKNTFETFSKTISKDPINLSEVTATANKEANKSETGSTSSENGCSINNMLGVFCDQKIGNLAEDDNEMNINPPSDNVLNQSSKGSDSCAYYGHCNPSLWLSLMSVR